MGFITQAPGQQFTQGSLAEGEASVHMIDPLVLTSLHQLLFILKILFKKQATIIRRSTVLRIPPQFVFPGLVIYHPYAGNA